MLFLKFIWQWCDKTSGGISVILFIASKLMNPSSTAVDFTITAFAALFICAIVQGVKLWRIDEERKPHLHLACGPEISGSVVPNQWQGGSNRFHRIAVTSGSKRPITGCPGRLIAIRGSPGTGDGWRGDTAVLTFAPGEHADAESKTIHPDVTVYLDVLMLFFGPADNYLGLYPGARDRQWRFKPSFAEIFRLAGEYLLTIQIVADDMPTLTRELKLTWRGPMGSELELL